MKPADRYRQLAEELDAGAALETLRSLEEIVRRGRPGDDEPAIFVEELAEARARGRRRRRRRPEILVLTVGHSPEPVFLSLAYHAPRRVILLLERRLAETYLEALGELWQTYRAALDLPAWDGRRGSRRVVKRRVRDSPGELFQAVRRIVAENPQDRRGVVLDITGAKKSMIAGAFLAAGFFDLEVSYVDFSDYDPALRRPDPASYRTVALRHPWELFRLRDERRLEEAFAGRHYREARDLAAELGRMAKRPAVRRIVGLREARRLAAGFGFLGETARAYALWGDGFYRDARDILTGLEGLPVPATVDLLGMVWPRRGDGHKAIVSALAEDKVFADPAVALAYFLDVLVWQDEGAVRARPREAFLRLYGAIESVIFYLLDVFVGRDPEAIGVVCEDPDGLAALRERFPRDSRDRALDWPAELRLGAMAFLRQSSTTALRVLSRPGGSVQPLIDLPRLLGRRAAEARPLVPRVRAGLAEPPIEPALYRRLFDGRRRGGPPTLWRFNQLRHKAVHWLAPVPAELALELRSYYSTVLCELIPLAVEHLLATSEAEVAAVRQHLEGWRRRLLAAAAGGDAGGCVPLPPEEVRRVLLGGRPG